ARLVLVPTVVLLASCATWRPNETWSFALTRDAYVGEPGTYRSNMFDPDHPRYGGVADLWEVGLVLLPESLTLAADVCALPVALPHDAYLACRRACGTSREERSDSPR